MLLPARKLKRVKRIAVLGSINADLVVHADRMPHAGETIQGSAFDIFPGGKGANQAVAAARLYSPGVDFAGMVGTDAFVAMLRESLTSSGVAVQHLETVQASSGVAIITIDRTGQNSIVVVSGANGTVNTGFVEQRRALIENAPILLLQLETPIEAVEYAAAIAFAAGVPVMLDPAPAQPLSRTLMEHVTWLTPNLTEACLLTGQTPPDQNDAATQEQISALLGSLVHMGAQNVALKLGRHGVAMAMHSGERHRLPALIVDAVDTTAAGDAFNGGFATALAEGKTPLEAAAFATAVAAISVTRHGAQPSMPHRHEIRIG